MSDFAGRMRLRGRDGRGKDTLLARIGAIRATMDAKERLRQRTGGPRELDGFSPGRDRLELEYPAGTEPPILEIRPEPEHKLTRVYADGICVAVLHGVTDLCQSDIRLVRDVIRRVR